MNEPVTCPKCAAMFDLDWRKKQSLWREIQHHLYMAHHIDVIESHRLADELTKDLQERVWAKSGTAR